MRQKALALKHCKCKGKKSLNGYLLSKSDKFTGTVFTGTVLVKQDNLGIKQDKLVMHQHLLTDKILQKA